MKKKDLVTFPVSPQNSIKAVYKIDTPITVIVLTSGFCRGALLPHSEYSRMNII